MKALIVEPSRFIAMMLSNVMNKHGVEVVAARTGGEALTKLRKQKFDLLCFAYVLGDMDGIKFIDAAHAQGFSDKNPALMFAATHDNASIHRASTAGVTECFSKHQLKELDKFVERFTAGDVLKVSGRVLLVEDSATAALFCMRTLTKMGLEVDACKSAEEALELLSKNVYDLVLTDYMLAGTQTGLAVIRGIRETRGRKSRTPILAMSALKDTARRIEILRSGANDFVGKPVIAEELEVRCHNLLNLQRFMQRLEMQNELMKDMATHDQLTSLYNRHFLHERLPELIDKAHKQQQPLSIAIIDIDHFKRVNDTHGHSTGDIVLSAVAETMQAAADGEKLCARFGGEEFVAVMPQTELAAAMLWADNLREAVARSNPAGIPVTISLGVASLQPAESFDTLFKRADEAVYRAKRAGRNRIELAE